MKTLSTYLDKYRVFQKEIPLIYRSSAKAWWNDRCIYLDENYSGMKKYNHRMILNKEIVIEFDEDEPVKNKELAESVIKKLIKDKIKYSLWHSGNKSYHVHFFLDFGDVVNSRLLKKSVMRYFTEGLDVLPDLQLASTHSIRAEYGLHEKTGKFKTKLRESKGYPMLCPIPQGAWDRYIKEMEKVQKWKMSMSVNDVAESDLVKELLDTKNFDRLNDGRERIVFVLSNILCHKYEKKELMRLLVDWYKYTNGKKLTEGQIRYKVHKAYQKSYTFTERYLNELIDDIKGKA